VSAGVLHPAAANYKFILEGLIKRIMVRAGSDFAAVSYRSPFYRSAVASRHVAANNLDSRSPRRICDASREIRAAVRYFRKYSGRGYQEFLDTPKKGGGRKIKTADGR
jgi:hypothetical protein